MHSHCGAAASPRSSVHQVSAHRTQHSGWARRPLSLLHWPCPLRRIPGLRRAAHLACDGGGGGGSNGGSTSGEEAVPRAVDADEAGRGVLEALATKLQHSMGAPLRGWTSDEVRQFEAGVVALGGPFSATPGSLKGGLAPGVAVSSQQLVYGLYIWRRRMRDAGVSRLCGAWLSEEPQSGRWTLEQDERFDAVVLSLGGPWSATEASIFKRMPDSGLKRHQLSSRLARWRQRQRGEADAAGTLPVVTRVLLRGWTPEQHRCFEAVVLSLGGPSAATAATVLECMPDGGLTQHQITCGLRKWRLLSRQDAVAAGAPCVTKGPSTKVWTPDACACLNAAVERLGGLAFATPKHVIRLMDAPESDKWPAQQVSSRLQQLRKQQRNGGNGVNGGGGGGGGGVPAGSTVDHSKAASGSSLGGEPPEFQAPHGWTICQYQDFLDAVGSLGGPFAATCKRVLALMPAAADGGLHLQQAQEGLRRWREALRRKADAAGTPLPESAWQASHWSPEASARMEAALVAQGGLAFATARRTLELMGAGDEDGALERVSRHLSLQRRQLCNARIGPAASGRRRRTGGGDDSACPPLHDGTATATALEEPLIHGWTPRQQQLFTDAVASLGGPLAADTPRILELLPAGSMGKKQVYNGLCKMRKQARIDARAAGATLPENTRGIYHWTPAACRRFDAAVLSLGGLPCAKPRRLLQLLGGPDSNGVTLRQLRSRLDVSRRRQRQQQQQEPPADLTPHNRSAPTALHVGPVDAGRGAATFAEAGNPAEKGPST